MALWDLLNQPPSREDVAAATQGSLLGALTEPEMAKATGTADRSSVKALIKQLSDRGIRVVLNPAARKIQYFGALPTTAERNFIRANRSLVVDTLTPPKPKAPTRYQKYIAQPVTKMAATGIKRVEPEFLQKNVVTPETLAKMVVPQDYTQLGILGGMIGSGGLALPERLAMSAMGGATGAAAGGESVPRGAATGLAAQLAGEAGGKILGGAGRLLFGGPIAEKTTADVGKTIVDALPSIGETPKTAADLERMFTHGDALKPLRAETARVSQEAEAAAPGLQFEVPVFLRGTGRQSWAKASLPDAEKSIAELNDQAYRLDQSGDPKWTEQGKLYRKLGYEARDRLAQKLNKVKAGLGDAWRQTRKDLTAGLSLQRLFNEPGVISPETGQIDQRVLDKLIKLGRPHGYWDELVNNLGRKKADAILSAVRRGGSSGLKTDVPGYGARMGMRVGGAPYIRPPIPPEFVGQTPWYTQPGPYRLPVGGLAGGAMNQGEQ